MGSFELKFKVLPRAFFRLLALMSAILALSNCGHANSESIDQSSLFSSYQKSEGFYKDKSGLPAAVSERWNSIYLVLTLKEGKFELGTAFLVEKETKAKTIKLFFMTNHHVVAACPVGKPCPKSALFSNAKLLIGPGGAKATAPENLMSPFTVERALNNPDLSLLSVEVPLSTVTPPILRLASSCELEGDEALYTIGFPNTALRTASGAKTIEDQNTMTKRWSQGFYVSQYTSKEAMDYGTTFAATTVDSLNGDSGAPLFNVRGEVVGVMQKSASDSSKQFAYDGHDWGFTRDWQSLAIPCERLPGLLHR